MFLANLLKHTPDVEAHHEYFCNRTFMTLSYYQPNHPYLEHILRRQRQHVAARFPENHTFIDVNPWLRFAPHTVRRTLDDALCFQLVRNGRDVVRSLYIGKTYTTREKTLSLLPNDPSTMALWDGYSRFEKLCWHWNETVSHLLKQRVPSLHLERIVSDYQYLHEHLLVPSGIRLERDVWRALKDNRLHPSRFRLKNLVRGRPVRLKWTPEHEASFRSICGETMRALGYE